MARSVFYSPLVANGTMSVIVDRVASGAGVTHTLGTLSVGAYTSWPRARSALAHGRQHQPP
jgi:hypothetical protein